MALRSIPIHRSLTRHNLFMGGDRELVMSSGLCAFALVFAAQTYVATVYGIFLWVCSLFVLRLMAKADPQMRQAYMRHRLYARYYPARSTPFRQNMREYQ